MNHLQDRVGRVLLRVGDALAIEGIERQAIVAPLSASQARNYLDPLVVDGLSRPIYGAYVAHDDPATVGEEGEWAGLELTVRGAMNLRVRDGTVARLLVLA